MMFGEAHARQGHIKQSETPTILRGLALQPNTVVEPVTSAQGCRFGTFNTNRPRAPEMADLPAGPRLKLLRIETLGTPPRYLSWHAP